MRLYLISLVTILTACSSLVKITGEEQTEEIQNVEYMCSGTNAKKVFTFTIASKFFHEKGSLLEISVMKEKDFNRTLGFVESNWMQHLFAHKFQIDSEKKLQIKIDEANPESGRPYAEVTFGLYPLMRVKDFSFAVLSEPLEGQIEPVTGKEIKKDGSWQYRDWFYNPYQFAVETKFYGGTFLNTHYFSIPERHKPSICSKAGLSQDCFDFPKDHKSLRTACRDSGPTTYEFFKENSGNCGHENAINSRIDLLEKAKNDRKFILLYESALATDLFLKIGTKNSKTFKDGWKITRIDWDPSLFCKYKRPVSDFYVQ